LTLLVQLGNTAPHEVLSHDDVKRRGLKVSDYDKHDTGKVRVPVDVRDAVTTLAVPDGRSLREAFLEVTHGGTITRRSRPRGLHPTRMVWLALLAENYGCDVAELVPVEEG
jgi:hypothetical protein